VEFLEGPAELFQQASQYLPGPRDADDWFQHVRLPDGASYIRWAGLFEFLVAPDGRRILGRPLEHASEEAFQTYLLNQVLSFALLRQGLEPIHATAVVCGAKAVAFIADTGGGKSCLGASFLQAGYRLLTDDLLILKGSRKGFAAYPGPPRIKLFPEIATQLLPDLSGGVPLNNHTPKLILQLREGQRCAKPAPLRALYVLAPGQKRRPDKVIIRKLSPRPALLEVIRSTFNTILVEPERLKRQFLQARALVGRVPVKRVSYPRALDMLPAVREAILDDIRP